MNALNKAGHEALEFFELKTEINDSKRVCEKNRISRENKELARQRRIDKWKA
jgi:hypothetical protein